MKALNRILILGLLSFSNLSFAQQEPPSDPAVKYVSSFIDEALSLYSRGLNEQALHGELCAMVDKHAAIDRMGNMALGRHRSAIPESQSAEFRIGFRAMLVGLLDGAFARFKDNKFVIEKFTRPMEDGFVVNVNIAPPARSVVRTQFFVLLPETSSGKLFDASVGGVRMMGLLKSEFDRMMTEKGVAGLFESLQSHPPCP